MRHKQICGNHETLQEAEPILEFSTVSRKYQEIVERSFLTLTSRGVLWAESEVKPTISLK